VIPIPVASTTPHNRIGPVTDPSAARPSAALFRQDLCARPASLLSGAGVGESIGAVDVGGVCQAAHMAEPSMHTHHALDYVELAVSDFSSAKAFYGSTFGWTFNDYGPGPAYVGIRGVGTPEVVEVGGFRLHGEVAPDGPLVLLYSSNLDSSVQAVRDAGGEVIIEPYDFPGGRRFHFRDPSGNELGVWSAH